MVRLRKQNKLVMNAKQIRASVIVKWLKQYDLRNTWLDIDTSVQRKRIA
jgi:hypothetical protein